MKSLITILFLSLTFNGFCQKSEYVYKNKLDSTYNCYLTIIPDSGKINGLIVRDYSTLPKTDNNRPYPYKWKDLALENGMAIVYTVTSNFFPELYYFDSSLFILDQLINEVVEKHDIPKQNIFIGGISASGTRALKYAQFCEMGKSKFGIKINGVFSVDSPLDFERFYNSAITNMSNFKDGMRWEAELMVKVFPQKFGGTPQTHLSSYQEHSVFSHSDSTGGNAKYLMNTALIFFHEPDIDWWIKERGASYYDINSFDIAGIYNKLKINGHQDVELITTTGKGFDRNGIRKCHSWTIVNEDYLIDWLVKRLKTVPNNVYKK